VSLPSALPSSVPEGRRDDRLVVDDPDDPIRVLVNVDHVDGPTRQVPLRADETETVRTRSGTVLQVIALRPRSRS
jgi:hypothetical protein